MSEKRKQPEPWMNLREAAEYLNVSVEYLRTWMSVVPGAHKIGGTGDWRVKATALDAWMEAHEQETKS